MTIVSLPTRGANAATIWSTTSSSGSVMWTRSAPATASPGEAATVAPNASSARAFAAVRFHTATRSPRRSIPSTIALPNRPVPRNATLAISNLPVESTPVPRVRRILMLTLLLVSAGPATAGHYRNTVVAAEPPRVLQWAGDPEGGAPFVEADPSHPDRVAGFDVDVAALLAAGVGRTPEFLNIQFTSIDQSIARGDAEIGLSGIEDTATRRATLSVTVPYYEFREVLSVRDGDAARLQSLADLRGRKIGTLAGTIAYDILLRAERELGVT